MIDSSAVSALEKALPAATLLIGPPGDAGPLARYLARHHGIHPSDVVQVERLSAESARIVVLAAQQAPPGSLKLIVISLDGSTEASQNILLRALEEPLDHVRFILASDTLPLATVVSRCQVYRMHGARYAEPEDSPVRTAVAAAIRAAVAQDAMSLARLSGAWAHQHSLVLCGWAAEGAAARWVAFSPEFAPGASRDQAIGVWKIVRQCPESPSTGLAALRRVFFGE